jgi:phosphoribosyl 1,2-cyclic phosphodiesterase
LIHFSSLGSGSEGNGLLVRCHDTCVLIDCGFSLAQTERRLARLAFDPSQLSAVLVTHEHTDHLGGVARLAKRYQLPVYASFGTLSFLRDDLDPSQQHIIKSDNPFQLGDVYVEPFAVPHDAREPLQFVLGDSVLRLGVLTDVGGTTPHIESMLAACDALFLETNHDRSMLLAGPYPQHLKARVGGAFGHLSNDESAHLLSRLDRSRLQHVVAAHLSSKNNTPLLAQTALASVLKCGLSDVAVADQELGLDWRMVA